MKKIVTASVISKDNGKTYEFNRKEVWKRMLRNIIFELTNVTGIIMSHLMRLVEFDGSSEFWI